MELKAIKAIFPARVFRIPDYQRPYSWEKQQLQDILDDIISNIKNNFPDHYTGTLVIGKTEHTRKWNGDEMDEWVIIDGQQRLTTITVYLAVVLELLDDPDSNEIKKKYLHWNGDTIIHTQDSLTQTCYANLLGGGEIGTKEITAGQRKLKEAYDFFLGNLKNKSQLELQKHKETLLSKLKFTIYELEDVGQAGMIFELMNNRGKHLTTLERLKNYAHYISHNHKKNQEQEITNTFTVIYKNLEEAGLSQNENNMTRFSWLLYIDSNAKSWKDYLGFKEKFPMEDHKKAIKIFDYLKFLKEVFILNYTKIYQVEFLENREEKRWLGAIHRCGNIAPFIPLLVAARYLTFDKKTIMLDDYIRLLKILETFSFRVFRWNNRRANAYQSTLFSFAFNLLKGDQDIEIIISQIATAIDWYSPTQDFEEACNRKEYGDIFNYWYDGLKYTLYEYEIFLINKNKQNLAPEIEWRNITKTTSIEHIYPQTPNKGSQWNKDWKGKDKEDLLHTIGNLVLTRDNSAYQNFEYSRKCGENGEMPSYTSSPLFQEREIAKNYKKWTPEECKQRSIGLYQWILDRWSVKEKTDESRSSSIVLDEEEDLED